MERIQKFLASAGIASRRACEELVKKGKIKSNGKVITELGTKIDPEKDIIEYNGRIILPGKKKIYIKFNKPAGYITSCSEEQGPTIFEMLKAIKERVYPVGRLDKNTSGLLLLTNDGDLALKLSHPRYGHEKEYECETSSPLTAEQALKLENGVEFGPNEKTQKAKVIRISYKTFRILLKEGKNRQIRRMVSLVGNKVAKLKRIRIDNIKLGNLKEGHFEHLQEPELKKLFNDTI